MAKAKEHNGHRSWNAWNVSLWIFNDESTYRLAQSVVGECKSKRHAARVLLSMLPRTTPDGARYNLTCVFEAISDLD